MLTTIEAEIDIYGNVRLLEPIKLRKKSRAIVTVLEDTNDNNPETKENAKQVSELLKTPDFANRKSYSVEEIEAQIEEARSSWE